MIETHADPKSWPPRAYKNLEFLNSPEARKIRVLCEMTEPERRFREENIEDTKVIKAWTKDLAKRTAAAAKADRTLPEKLYLALYRPTEVSLFIRWLRSTLFRPTCYRAALDLLRPLMLKYL